mmetsp:Transcript_169999/g.413269  ORF Transcript_169999/g.413269 Transcript_169999/m.413269 type:complete len:245 (-) Transcript_169999:311-1045(-)
MSNDGSRPRNSRTEFINSSTTPKSYASSMDMPVSCDPSTATVGQLLVPSHTPQMSILPLKQHSPPASNGPGQQLPRASVVMEEPSHSPQTSIHPLWQHSPRLSSTGSASPFGMQHSWCARSRRPDSQHSSSISSTDPSGHPSVVWQRTPLKPLSQSQRPSASPRSTQVPRLLHASATVQKPASQASRLQGSRTVGTRKCSPSWSSHCSRSTIKRFPSPVRAHSSVRSLHPPPQVCVHSDHSPTR